MMEQAVLIVSGKVLDRKFPLSELENILESIERELSDRGVALTRRVVTLNAEHRILAGLFLNAGFETVPADDEDVQASSIAFPLVYSPCPPSEIVFALGMDEEPVNFLRSFNGLTRRTLLCFNEREEQGTVSIGLARATENLLYAPTLLAKIDVDWKTLDRRTFNEWLDGVGGSVEQEASSAQKIEQEKTEERKETQELETPQKTPESFDVPIWGGDVPEAPDSEANDHEINNLIADIEPATIEVEDVLNHNNKFAAIRSGLIERAGEWNEVLEQYVLDTPGKACSASKTLERLDYNFHGIFDWFISDREDFVRHLGQEVKLAIDDASGTYKFYHYTHEDMRVATAGELTLGGKRDVEPIVPKTNEPASLTRSSFADIAKEAALLADETRWMIERRNNLQAGIPFEQATTRDSELSSRAKNLHIMLWHIDPQYSNLPNEAYRELAECYDILADALKLMDTVERFDQILEYQCVARAVQDLANVQCLVKSALLFYGVPPKQDYAQVHAFNRLRDYRDKFCSNTFIYNMRFEDQFELADIGDIRASHEELAQEIYKLTKSFKSREELTKKLTYHLDSIKKSPDQDHKHDWNTVVNCVTDLIILYRVQPSSIEFRDRLIDLIDSIPEDVETTTEFGLVVQEIDYYREREFERALTAESEEEREPSKNVLAVRERLNGGKIVFIGGTPKQHIRERVEKAFGVEMIWVETNHGDSLDRFETYLNDPDVKLFLSYIPWCSHKHSEEFVSEYTKRWNKDSVRLRKGTNPEQMAVGILNQLKWTEAK